MPPMTIKEFVWLEAYKAVIGCSGVTFNQAINSANSALEEFLKKFPNAGLDSFKRDIYMLGEANKEIGK
jgi:hypothetical protein